MRVNPAAVSAVAKSLQLPDDETTLEVFGAMFTQVIEAQGSLPNAVRALRPSKAIIAKLDSDLRGVLRTKENVE